MRFIVDECAGPNVSTWLSESGHDCLCVYRQARGASDKEVLALASTEQRILITCDKDFGERVFLNREPHQGIILLRLEDETSKNKCAILKQLLDQYGPQLTNHFTVASEKVVRISPAIPQHSTMRKDKNEQHH